MQALPAIPARTRVFVLAVCLVLFNVPQGHAAVPNDLCSAAEVIPGNASFPYLTPIVQDVRLATTNGDPAEVECITEEARSNLTRSVWYTFTPPAGTTNRYTVTTGPDAGTTVGDPVLAVYTAPSGCNGPFVSFACNDDSGGANNFAGISTEFIGGTTYYLVVWVGEGTGELTDTNSAIQLRVSIPTAITNDACSGAQLIPSNVQFPYLTGVTDNTLATNNRAPECPPPLQDGVPSRDVWYEFTPPTSGTYIFSTGADTATTVIDTLLAIYSSPSPCGSLTPVVCNNNSVGRAVVPQALTAGTRYYIVVWDNEPEPIPGSTLVELRVSQAGPPSVTTLPATSISSTGAVLNGTVNPNGLQSRYWIEWGLTTSLGNTSPVPGRLLFAGTTTLATNLPLSVVNGFQSNTTYFYSMAAGNSRGTNHGSINTFMWSAVQPQLVAPAPPANGNFSIRFSNGNPGQLYLVQSSTNVGDATAWTDLGFARNPSSTEFEYIDRGGGFAPTRFYRVKLP